MKKILFKIISITLFILSIVWVSGVCWGIPLLVEYFQIKTLFQFSLVFFGNCAIWMSLNEFSKYFRDHKC